MAKAAFADNVVIITGASAGIGRELALQLADQGALLALAARDREALKEVAALCRARGGKAVSLPTDVGKEIQCRSLIENTVKQYGRIDTLVNNAGVSMWTYLERLQRLDVLDEIMRVNYLGSAYCTYHALPHLRESRGRLVAVSSLAGRTGVPTRSGYSASKHAQVGFFDTLRIELAGSGVSVTVIYPDFVTSEIRERAFGADGKPLGKGNSPVQETEVMPTEECARIMIRAMAARKREEIMGVRGKLGLWVRLIAPGLIDRIAMRAIQRGR